LGSRMTTDLLEPVASLEEMEGSAVFPPSQPSSHTFRHERLEITDTPVIQAGRLPSHPPPLTFHLSRSCHQPHAPGISFAIRIFPVPSLAARRPKAGWLLVFYA